MSEDGYQGRATLTVADTALELDVELRGHFQPIDGYYRWYGRVAASPELTELTGGKKATAVITTPHGSATGELADPDPWGRYRITGTSTPPFAVPTTLDELEV